MSKSLYELTSEIEALETMEDGVFINEETGEIATLEEALNQLQLEFDAKCENIACWVKNLNAEAEMIEQEEKKLYARRKSCENKAERLKAYLKSALDGKKFKTARCNVGYRNTTSIDITDLAAVPDAYKRVKIEESADKKAIKAAFDNGEIIPGCAYVTTMNISIR